MFQARECEAEKSKNFLSDLTLQLSSYHPRLGTLSSFNNLFSKASRLTLFSFVCILVREEPCNYPKEIN